MDLKERLDKILTGSGVASRSEAKKLIRDGRVMVDGKPVQSPEEKIDRENSEVRFDGELIDISRFRYFIMNKPSGILSVTEDRKQQTVLDLLSVRDRNLGLFPVGRLDKDTEGLLLLTNDGDFSHKIISPSSAISKVYYAEVDGIPNDDDVKAFSEGLMLGDGTRCLPARLELKEDCSCLVTVFEGKYHQVKRMLASRGKPVRVLKRLSVGGLILPEDLKSGEYRELDNSELCKIFNGN